MRCTRCGVELIPGKPFCHGCGARVSAPCPQCGAVLQPEFRFCPDCGRPVDGATPPEPRKTPDPPPRPAPGVEGERKIVTVLFCDLVGSTQIAEKLDPEDYHELLERYLELAFQEIYKVGGVVNQISGDGLMALFGAPIAYEDAPQRAVRAALGIREALGTLAERMRRERGISLRARQGLHTGPVVVGTVGNSLKMDYTAIGDTVNLAARLESLAEPGAILMSDATHRLVRGFFEVEPTGPLDVRGKSEPVEGYRVLAEARAVTPMGLAEARGLTPFVGRAAELAMLEQAFAQVAAGRMQIAGIVAHAGVGKSRLVHEFRQRLAPEVVVFDARCAALTQSLAYHPFMAMFRGYLGFEVGEAPEQVRSKIASKLGVPFEHVKTKYPGLTRFLGTRGDKADVPAEQLRRETVTALAGLVGELGAEAPVVMVIEDFEWIDEPSRDMLDDLVERLAASRVLLVITQRADAKVRWEPAFDVVRIELARLDEVDTAAVVRAVAGGHLPEQLTERIVRRAGGSPFFAEELTRALIEEGVLLADDAGGHRLAKPLEEVGIPGTVQEVIAARLDRLDGPTKRVLQVASVLGRQFHQLDLEALLADERVDVAAGLKKLERKGLLRRLQGAGGTELRFPESLTQEVAYEGVLLRQRRQMHERIAAFLEAAPGEATAERTALIAEHYAHGDDHAKAADYLLQAAREAEAVPSYGAAADFYRRAWQRAESVLGVREDGHFHAVAAEAAAGVSRMVVFFGASHLDVAEDAARRGEELAELLGDDSNVIALRYQRGVAVMMRGEDFDRGLAVAEEALALAERLGSEVERMRLIRGLCISWVADGRFAEARERAEEIVARAELDGEAAELTPFYLSSRWVRDQALFAADELDLALSLSLESHEMSALAPNRTMRSAAASLLAQIYFMRAHYAEARRWADEATLVGDEIGNVNVLTAGGAIALVSRLALGERVDPRPFVHLIERGLAGAGFMQLNARFVSDALLASGDLERADRVTERMVGRAGGRLRNAMSALARGDVLAALDRHEEAARRYAEAVKLADRIGARSTLAAGLLASAELALRRGQQPAGVERALRICQEVGLARYRDRFERVLGDAAPQAVS
jgi:class 3 adenylate cyclase/tetratricopeptide (TPR) repeat protein